MNAHPVTFEDLADWLDGRLPAEAQRRVEEHLAAGCAVCGRDVAWLRRFKAAADSAGLVQPPPALVARAKAGFRIAAQPWAARLRLPRPAPATCALLALVALIACLALGPTAFARGASLAAAGGTVEALHAGGSGWQPIAAGSYLREGDRLRATGGPATLALFDGSTAELQPGAEVALSSLRAGLFGLLRRVDLFQATGTVLYDVSPLPGRLAAFAVASPTARVSVRGTRFIVAATEAETRVEVLQGAVALAGALDSAIVHSGESAVAPAQARLRLGPRALPAPTPTPGHTPTQANGGQGTAQPPEPATPSQGEMRQGTPASGGGSAGPTHAPGPGSKAGPGPTRTPTPRSSTAPGPAGLGPRTQAGS